MTTIGSNLDKVLVTEREHWQDGPPYELFKELRNECPVHWSADQRVPGGGRLLVGHDGGRHPRRQPRLGDLLVRARRRHRGDGIFPLELMQAMFIGMDPPKHDRVKALFQAGFTPKRIADHEDEIRAITIDVLDRLEGRRPATSSPMWPSRWSRA